MTDRLIACFVYGTLRPRAWNDRGGYENIRRECTVEGKVYWVSGRSGYPVAKLDESGRISGDVLWFPKNSGEWHSIVRMEEGAGYELWDVTALASNGDEIPAVAWHYRGVPRGKLIPDGDWLKAHDGLYVED